jgi:hypothetical protein
LSFDDRDVLFLRLPLDLAQQIDGFPSLESAGARPGATNVTSPVSAAIRTMPYRSGRALWRSST